MTLDSISVRAKFRGQVCQAYNEAAFKHFLRVERARAQRSRRFLYLVLVSMRHRLGPRAKLTEATRMALLRGLAASVREVDFVGWYVDGQVAAAALPQGVNGPSIKAALIADRVLGELQTRLTAAESNNLRVRVIRLGGRAAR